MAIIGGIPHFQTYPFVKPSDLLGFLMIFLSQDEWRGHKWNVKIKQMSNAPKKNTPKATPLGAPSPPHLHLSDRSYEPLDHRTPAAMALQHRSKDHWKQGCFEQDEARTLGGTKRYVSMILATLLVTCRKPVLGIGCASSNANWQNVKKNSEYE
jgi:hypothetical protein